MEDKIIETPSAVSDAADVINDANEEFKASTPVLDSIIDEDNLEAFKVLSMRTQIEDMQRLTQDIKAKQDSLIKDQDDSDIIDANLEKYTLDEVKAMDRDGIEAIFTAEDGRSIELVAIDDKEDNFRFKKNYAVYRKDSNVALKALDEEIEKFQKEMEESEVEMESILNQFNDMDSYIRSILHDKIEKSEDEHKKKLYEDMLKTMDNAFSLDNVVEYYSNAYKRRTVIPDYRNDHKSMQIYKKYKTVVEQVGFKTDLTKYIKLEQKFLPEKYHSRTNLFLFSIISMASSWSRSEDNRLNGLFLTQFSVNLKNMIYDKFVDKEDRQRFIDNICKVLDLFV